MRVLGTDFYFSAALLLLFGAAEIHHGGPHGPVEVLLGLAMAGAGAGLSTRTVEAWWFGVGVSGVTLAFGAWQLVVVGDLVPGCIVAIYPLLHLFAVRPGVRAGTAPHPMEAPPAAPATPVSWVPPVPPVAPVLPAQAPPPADGNDFFGGRLAERRD